MADIEFESDNFDISKVQEFIAAGKPYNLNLNGPSTGERDYLKGLLTEYLKQVGKEESYSLLRLCMDEIISNSVKANIKRTYFIVNNLDINNHKDYEAGIKSFHDVCMSICKEQAFVQKILDLGFYVRCRFHIENNILTITTRNNSVISQEEIARIEKKLALAANQTPEQIFMNSIDMTEGAGLGIIMINKIISQVSTLQDRFSIRATETETVTELKINKI